MIERGRVGGTCLNWGCIPSKVLINTAELLLKMRHAEPFGLHLDGTVVPDIASLMARKNRIIDIQAAGIHNLLDHYNIRLIDGKATIKAPQLLSVTSSAQKVQEVRWDQLIIASGSRPLEIPSMPFDHRKILSSNDALSLEKIPDSILIVGGGVIGCEFAFMLQALGTHVTLVEALDRILPLPSVDQDCSKTLQREMKKKKISFLLNQTVQRITLRGEKIQATVVPPPWLQQSKSQEKPPVQIETDHLLVCVGRTPNTDGLGLETIGVQTDEHGWVLVNDRLATNAQGVYAIGDVLGPSKIMLAHVASAEGTVAAENATGGDALMDYAVVPNAIFTMPEVATVGLTEIEAQKTNPAAHSETVLFRNLGKAQATGEIAGQMKIVFDSGTKKLLGLHIVGPHATDLVAEGALAIRMGCTAKDIAETIHAHPTLSEIMQEGALKAMGRPLHG
jgi:dihydrolipoamide dehydrogenase